MKKTVSLFIVLFGLSATQAQSIPAEVYDLIQNQNSIQTAASDESFLIDGVVWSRPYGEKLYHLTPSVPNVLEYESKIRAEAELSDAGPNAAKFHFAVRARGIRSGSNNPLSAKGTGTSAPDMRRLLSHRVRPIYVAHRTKFRPANRIT
jgi:hypothetical protein